jgi:hypothetical protein
MALQGLAQDLRLRGISAPVRLRKAQELLKLTELDRAQSCLAKKVCTGFRKARRGSGIRPTGAFFTCREDFLAMSMHKILGGWEPAGSCSGKLRALRYTPYALLHCVKRYTDVRMPLPKPDYPRKPMHNRSIQVHSFEREDGLMGP